MAALVAAGRPRRDEVLDALRNAAGHLGVTEVAEQVGVHANTARFHLDALVESGVVTWTVERPAGLGRPRIIYAARPGIGRRGGRNHRLLARILLGQLSRNGPDPGGAAEEAGRLWGGFLVDPPKPFQPPSAEQAAERLTALLNDLGFAPETAPGPGVPVLIRLRHCPFLELAEEHGPLVRRIYLGLMRGALAELRAPLTANLLDSFAGPSTCTVHLRRVDAT